MAARSALIGSLAAFSLLALASCGEMPEAEDGEDARAEQSEADDEGESDRD